MQGSRATPNQVIVLWHCSGTNLTDNHTGNKTEGQRNKKETKQKLLAAKQRLSGWARAHAELSSSWRPPTHQLQRKLPSLTLPWSKTLGLLIVRVEDTDLRMHAQLARTSLGEPSRHTSCVTVIHDHGQAYPTKSTEAFPN